jgi:predicted ATP-grasp superfamily ATP-dependent carboligase
MGLAVIRSLGVMGVPISVFYYNNRDMGHVSRYVREKVHTPHPEKFEEQFIDLLINYSKKIGKGVLFPADDETLKVVSRNKKLLQNYYTVACAGWEITEQFIDKKYTYALAERIGVPCPKTLIPKSVSELEMFGKSVDYPCLIKPCESHRYFELFRRKMVKVDNIDQMLAAYREATNAGLEVMVQEFIPGDDTKGVNYNSYFWEGKPLVEFTAEKVRLAPPSFGVPRVVLSKEIQEIIEPGRRILEAMGFYGYSCTEFKKDIRDGIYKFMEVNGRHNRSGLLSLRCGINFPWIEYRHLAYGELPSVTGFRSGVYWIDEIGDIVNSIKYHSQERFALKQYFLPYLRQHVFSVFDAKDPMPFAKRCLDLSKILAGTLFPVFKRPPPGENR